MDPLKTQPQPEAKLHFLDYWRIIRIRKTVILTVFLLVFVTATLVTYILPKGYESKVRIKIEGNGSDIAEMIGPQNYGNMPYDPYFIATEFEVIKSELVLGQVISLLDLDVEWGNKYGGAPLKKAEAMKVLRNRLTLSPDRNTKLVNIRVSGPDPAETTKIANTIALVYRDRRMQERRDLAMGGINQLETRYKEQEALVAQIQNEADALRTNLDISDIDAQGVAPAPSLESETLRRYGQERIEYENNKIATEKLLAQLEPLTSAQLRQVLPTTVKDSTLTELLNQLNSSEQRLVLLQKSLGEEHPDYLASKRLVDKVNEQINARVEGIMRSLRTQAAISKSQFENVETRVTEAKERDQEKAARSRPYYDKKRELESAMRFRDILKLKIESEKIDMNLPKRAMVTIVDAAVLPRRPSSPNRVRAGALLLVGLLLDVAGLATLFAGRRSSSAQRA